MTDEIEMTEAQQLEEMEKVDASPLSKLKKVLVLAKTAFIIFQTVKAAIAWRRSRKPMGIPAQMCLLFSALIVALGCAYKFTSKLLMPIVVLQAMSHYLCFIIIHVLLGYVQCNKFENRAKILKVFWMFHACWWVVIFFAFKTTTCTKEHFYPDTLFLNDCFSFGIYIMVYMLHSKDFTLEWTESESKAKSLFKAQIDRYMSFYTFLVEWHIIELVVGKGLDTFTDSITCSEDGTAWIYNSSKGSLFLMFHIIGTMMGTGMARAVFIKTAKAEGFFGGVEDKDSSDSEDEKKDKKDTKKKQ